jgi:release factor glutamine methyltransferase
MRLVTAPGVFRPRSDAFLLADVLRERLAPGASVLDPFTGSGVLAIAAAQAGAGSVTAVDVSRRAVLVARANARLNRARVRVLRGDLFEPVRGERFDVIAANPPYLPSPAADRTRRAARAWEGGPDGRELIERLCAGAPAHLRPGGLLLLVQSSVCGLEPTLEELRARGLRAELVARERGPMGPLLRRRAPELEARGLLRPGERDEDLLVVGARR